MNNIFNNDNLIFQKYIIDKSTVVRALVFISKEVRLTYSYTKKYITEIFSGNISKNNTLAIVLFGSIKIARYKLNYSSLKKMEVLLLLTEPFKDIQSFPSYSDSVDYLARCFFEIVSKNDSIYPSVMI